METDQSNYLAMATVTDDVIEANEASWTALPAFATEVALSRTYLGSIRADGRGQLDGDTRPHTKMRDMAKKTLARLATDSGAPASVLAEINGDLAAAATLTQSYSDIYYATDLDAENLVVNLLAAARALDPAILANYGVTAAKLDVLQQALDQYSEKIGSSRLTIVKRHAKTASLEELFAKLRDVHSRMDRLAIVFRSTAPDFLAAYQAARIIIDRPATQGSTEEPPAPLPA